MTPSTGLPALAQRWAARRPRRRPRVLPVAVLLAVVAASAAQGPSAVAEAGDTYTNPVATDVTTNFADPTIIRGRDGWYYAYATNGRRFSEDERQLMMIMRSADLVDWEWVGPVFTPETMPRYDGQGADVNRQLWAPEIAEVDGRYVLYYSYVVNTPGEEPFSVIAAATADHPAGPWTDTGAPVTGPEQWEPRPGVTEWRNVIDPELVTTPDGTRYLYYGSVLGGVRVVELSEDGLTAVGEPVPLTPEHRYEAAYVVHREGYYYLFLSEIGGCCAGPASGYPVVVARSADPLGPFVDAAGHPVAGRYAGGTPVLNPNGNAFVSTGHNAVATDVAGQDWLVSHAIDRTDPYLDGRENSRRLALTRLDWIDGWPVADAGAGMPDQAVPAPATRTLVADAFEPGTGELSDRWHPAAGWAPAEEASGGFARTERQRPLVSRSDVSGDVRVRAAVRLDEGADGRAGFGVFGRGRPSVQTWIDRDAGELVLSSGRGGRVTEDRAPLPASFRYQHWHQVELVHRGTDVQAQLTESGQYDPVASVSLTAAEPLPDGPVVLQADGTSADFDDVTAAELFTPVTERVAEPEVGTLSPADSEEFDAPLGPEWEWVREPAATVADGALEFGVQTGTLIDSRPKPENQASVLLRDMPAGEWTVETRVRVPFGDTLPHGWPLAGLIAYDSDDEWVGLGYTTRVSPRFAAFAKETRSAGDPPVYGHAALGPSADTMWLRLRHTVDADGEHLYRAATSVDGQEWVWHGTRVLPAGEQPRVGLVAMDLDDHPDQEPLTATFDWFRVHR